MTHRRGGRPAPAPPSAISAGGEQKPRRRALRGTATGLLLLLLLGWATLALFYARIPGFLAPAYAAANLAALLRFRGRAVPWLAGLWLVVFGWWTQIEPRNDRDWRPDVARLARAEIDGDAVTIHGLRDLDWTGAEEFTPRYRERTFDLSELQGLDYFFCYWGDLEAVAHSMVSFDFGEGGHLALSIEVRPERGESYDPVAGLFKRYEIVYVLAEESDVVRVRTHYRNERVYLFPTRAAPEEARALLLDVLERVNELYREPAFYHTIGRNCTTAFVDHINAVWPGRVPLHRKLLLNGYAPELAYERGSIMNDRPFEEVRRLHRIDPIARQHEGGPDFGRRIREHLP